MPREHEGHLIAGAYAELGDRAEVLPPGLDRGRQAHEVGTRDAVEVLAHPAHPRHDPAVIETHHQVHTHRHPARDPLDDPDDAGVVSAAGHAVHHPNDALCGVEVGLEHEGLAPVAATDPVVSAGRSDLPEPVLLTAQ